MKKIFIVSVVTALALLICQPAAFSQKKSKKELKEMREKMVKSAADDKNIFIVLSSMTNKKKNSNLPIAKSGAESLSYTNTNYTRNSSGDGIDLDVTYYIYLNKNRISCYLPFECEKESRVGDNYSNNSFFIHIDADNKNVPILGGLQKNQKSYMFQCSFKNTDKLTLQVTVTMQVYPSGKVYAMVEIPSYDTLYYEGTVIEIPEHFQQSKGNN